MLALMLATLSNITLSEDIELFISEAVRQANKKTKVLIIFDTSGSMKEISRFGEPYINDPDNPYIATDSAHAYDDNMLYFNRAGADNTTTIPNSPSDVRRFTGALNGCFTSIASLAENGTYTDYMREYRSQDNEWQEVRNNSGADPVVIDCRNDAYYLQYDENGEIVVGNEGSRNNAAGFLPGYPIDGEGTSQNPIYYDNRVPAQHTNVDWYTSDGLITLYTANYLRWYHGQSTASHLEQRLQTAKDSIRDVINSTPLVEFGLEVFNFNYGDDDTSGNGGRIAAGIKEMTDDNRANLLNIIANQISAEGSTPLCESVYEASQYFAGALVDYGDDDIDVRDYNYSKNIPPMATDITEVVDGHNVYKTPFVDCASSVANIILITDGAPQHDFAADSKITAMVTTVQRADDADGNPVYESLTFTGAHTEALTDETNTFDGSVYPSGNRTSDDSYLPALASWMSEYDINLNRAGKQTVVTHTIGFSNGAIAARGLLQETARRGKGEYVDADTGTSLIAALKNILDNLPEANDSLTSASVSANSYDRTQTLDSVYYGMFEPNMGARWQGNLKKYKVVDEKITGVGADGNGDGVDVICDVAGSSSFCDTARSFWSTEADGNIIGQGGVLTWFNSHVASDRKLYMENGDGSGDLITFNRTNLEAAFTAASTSLAAVLGVTDADATIQSTAVDDMLAWATGVDVDDEDEDTATDNMRKSVFGDPLHSKPLVINYGNAAGTGDDIRIVIGTNSGALHMFKDNDTSVAESWAFMPTEFINNIKPLRTNPASANKIYGIDGEISIYQDDKNGDGIIGTGDTAWIFFGLRRGGSSYYALDISSPDAPKLLWRIDSSKPNFTQLGQSWSQPKIAYSALNFTTGTGSTAKPVLFIGGGYDTKKDSAGVATSDDKGQGIYMLDAATGGLLWSGLPTGGTTVFPGEHSIPSPIALLDSTGDGLIDRLYTGDTGGNVWRVDMPGKETSDFSISQLASLGGGGNDQRFFYEPTIARALISEVVKTEVTDADGVTTEVFVHQEIPYDAILLGSGDRTTPLGKDTTDTLYMIKDSNIITKTFPSSPDEDAMELISKTDLYNYTYNPFDAATDDTAKYDLQKLVSEESGWYIDLRASGEKSTASALVIKGVAYFTTYTPASSSVLINCIPPKGSGELYAVDLALGTRRNLTQTEVRDNDDRVIKINNDWLGPPTLIMLPDTDNDDTTVDPITGDIIVGDKVIPVDFSLATIRTYLYSTEVQ